MSVDSSAAEATAAASGAGTDGSPSAPGPRLDWRIRLGLLACVWGLSFLFIKVGGEAFAPLQVALARVAFGAVTLLCVLVLRRERLPRALPLWAHLAVAAFLLNALPFTLFTYAEQRIPSALAGICNATTPLFTLLSAALVLPGERPTRRSGSGMLIGFLGVLVVFGIWRGVGGQNLAGTATALCAALSMGAGWTYIRRFLSDSGQSSLSLSAAQLLAGAVELALAAPFLTTLPSNFPLGPTLSVLVLGALGTGVAFQLQYGLVRDAGATVASMVTYLVPIVSTVTGVVVLGETVAWNAPVGAVVILAGAALSARPAAGGARRKP
ncbi:MULTISPECIES: DMT family transporter [Streptomyces]|uniref:DMT family transporter n=1 Tax=Streptomyces TaxID=1883 RepID=UPI0004BEF6E5|nr:MULTISPECIES: DMT family transporter [Streptomyces]